MENDLSVKMKLILKNSHTYIYIDFLTAFIIQTESFCTSFEFVNIRFIFTR